MGSARTRRAGRRLGACVAAVVAAAVFPTVTASPAAAQDSFKIKAFGRCVEVKDGSRQDGAPIQLYRCYDWDSQRFTFEDVGNGTVRIKTFAGKCLEVQDGSLLDGVPIVQGPCHDWRVDQEFAIVDLGNGEVSIENAGTLLWWTVGRGTPAPIVQYPLNFGPGRFTLEY